MTSNGVFSIDSSGAIAEVAQIQKGEALWADENRVFVSKTDQRLMVLENGAWSCLTTLPSRATKIRGIGTTLCCSLRNGHSLFIDLQLLSSKLIEGGQLIDGGPHFYYLKRPAELILCSLTGEIRPIAQVPEGIGCIKPDGALCWIEAKSERELRNINPIYDWEAI